MSFLATVLVFLVACVVIALVARVMTGDWGWFVFVGIFGLIVSAIALTMQYKDHYHNERWITCYVTEKDRGGQDGSYRVYTDNCGTLANRDSWFRFKTNSADVWQTIREGQTYRLHVAGARVDRFSWFPNILEVQKVDG